MTDFERFALSNGIGSNVVNSYGKFLLKNSYINPSVIEERQNTNMINIDIFSRLLMDRILFLGTEITPDVANILVAQLLWLEQQSDMPINLYVNSPGGDVQGGLALIDCMNFIRPSIYTYCVGTAASMAAVLFSNGNKGNRYIMPHGRLMIHQVSGGAGRTQCADIQIMAKEMETLQKEIYEILSSTSGMPVEEIEKMADRDCWMKAEDAIRNGFADKIIMKDNVRT